MTYFDIICALNEKYIEAKNLLNEVINEHHLPLCDCNGYINIVKRTERALHSMILASKDYDDGIIISHDFIERTTALTEVISRKTITVPFIVG